MELGKVTDAKVISELQVAISDEQVKIQSIKEKLNSLKDYIHDSSFQVKVK